MKEIERLGIELYNIDNKRVISILQKNGIFIYKQNPTKEDVVICLNNIVNTRVLDRVIYSFNYMIIKFKQERAKNKDFSILKIKKQIEDYVYVINNLKNKEITYKKNLMIEDTNTMLFEKYSQEWADIQDKIKLLTAQLKELTKKLPKYFR